MVGRVRPQLQPVWDGIKPASIAIVGHGRVAFPSAFDSDVRYRSAGLSTPPRSE